jgi:hypothetical protein
LCDGVITTPSAVGRPWLLFHESIACETTGVGVYPKSLCSLTSTSFAANTSTLVLSAGSRECVSVHPDEQGAVYTFNFSVF